jgi:UDP-N-acetylmuramoyl-tripeptide--D-alanyl-D-alanine ligase
MDHDEIAARLATFTLPPMRLESLRVGPLTLINDAYNANPASLAAAVAVLEEMAAPRRRVLIVGDMRELGESSERLHKEAAETIARSNVQMVVAVGERAKLVTQTVRKTSANSIETHAFATTELARKRLTSYLRPDDTILIKGSRALGLEKLAELTRIWAESRPVKRPAKALKRPGNSSRRDAGVSPA